MDVVDEHGGWELYFALNECDDGMRAEMNDEQRVKKTLKPEAGKTGSRMKHAVTGKYIHVRHSCAWRTPIGFPVLVLLSAPFH